MKNLMAFGETVYVALGHLTAKNGQVVGMRVTTIPKVKEEVEYLISWFGPGDRPNKEEWFHGTRVHSTPDAAFK